MELLMLSNNQDGKLLFVREKGETKEQNKEVHIYISILLEPKLLTKGLKELDILANDEKDILQGAIIDFTRETLF